MSIKTRGNKRKKNRYMMRLRGAWNRTPVLIKFLLISAAVMYIVFRLASHIQMEDKEVLQALLSTGPFLSVVFVGLQLEKNKTITECQFLDSLNKSFFADRNVLSLYEELQVDYDLKNPNFTDSLSEQGQNECSNNFEEPDDSYQEQSGVANSNTHPKDMIDTRTATIVRYLSCFESLYLLYENGLVKMSTIDDLFGHRFFLAVEDPKIYDGDLFKTYQTYNNIFRLYDIWRKYRGIKENKLINNLASWIRDGDNSKYRHCNESEFIEWIKEQGYGKYINQKRST